ncbi:AAA family ATPase [Thiorhodovibrio frisius]|uniref:AAA+ family ATPase n=1 Tax=Thiorhodovibrio frisius TaxID=631362 RepID=H8Z663_9GAMM|nr:ATP-binding protein [Thiorhodovibrio frisius]EIC19630.1 AAA+ family ATPase [Thiorhodovibrio frisius]WPL20404.1 ATP-dependent zinc metalloprotease FtsH [Thiorhodovibrio frisius]
MTDNLYGWRSDLNAVPTRELRLARFALGLLCSDKRMRERLDDRDFLRALWELTGPLLPSWVRDHLVSLARESDDDDTDILSLDVAIKRLEADDQGNPPPSGRKPPLFSSEGPLRTFYRHLPHGMLKQLDQADGNGSVSPLARLLAQSLGLDATAERVLEYLDLRNSCGAFVELVNEAGNTRTRLVRADARHGVAAMLRLDEPALRRALRKSAPLRQLGLLESRQNHPDIEDLVRPSDLLSELFEAEPKDEAALLARLVEPAPAGDWTPAAFPHLRERVLEVQETLAAAARSGVAGVNALFYGPPGTGKTELARALVAACGLTAYQVASTEKDRDGDEDGLDRDGRLSAYLVAQRLLAKRGDAVIIFDEVEDVITQQDSFFAFFGGAGPTGEQKGWMNRILEENPVPAIWISNQTRGMDAAFQRRFLLPVAFVTPPRSVRLQMAERHLGDLGLPPTLLEELAADDQLTPATLGAARRLLDLRPDAPKEATVRRNIAAMRRLLHGAPAPRRREQATDFDVGYLNLAGGIQPNALVRALEREGTGRLCFYGPPGTGKTAFAEVLAEALDRELIARQASDLISPYVGETEQNLAELFVSLDAERSVLLLDEVDSFLAERRQAQHSWERTQVNELLQQMERFPGIFIAATNLMRGLDAAALRRFDFKLHFRALKPEQRIGLFAREALGDAVAVVPMNLARHLERLDHLTPGDFANVCRQQRLLGERLAPEDFLRRLIAECRLKDSGVPERV